MLCLESSFLVDWFQGQEYARTYLQSHDPETRVLVPTVVLHELFVGALDTGRYPTSPGAVYHALDATEFVGLSAPAAEKAAEIRIALRDQGEQINPFDTLIAGVAIDAGATLVTTDGHFERVDDLEIVNPRTEQA